MKKRVLSIFLVLLMAVMLVPGVAITASAAPLTEKIDLTGAAADTSGDGWTWVQSTKTFTMNGLDLTVANDHGIMLPGGSNLVIEGVNTITVTGDNSHYDGIRSAGALNITGTGVAVIEAPDDGIQGEEVTLNGPTLDITARFGIYTDIDSEGTGDIEIISGTVIADAEESGILAEGDVSISGGRVKITSDNGKGICAEGDILVSAGEIEIVSYDESIYAEGSIVISGGRIDTVSEENDVIFAEDGDITISNATVIIKGGESGDGLAANANGSGSGSVYINGGAVVSITSIDDNGIEAGGNIVISGTAQVTITNSESGMIAGKDVIINGGTITIDTELRGISVNDAVYFNGGTTSVRTDEGNGRVVMAYYGYIYVAAGLTVTNGVSAGASDGNGNYDEIQMTSALPVIISGANGGINIPLLPTVEAPKYMPFTDVLQDAWYYDDVFYCYDNGLMDGVDTYTFAPNQSITRGMIVTILWRNEGRPYAAGDGFKDVAKGMYYTDAVKWAVSKGIVKGYGDGTFRPDEPVSLEELAAIMFRYAAHKNLDTTARGALSVYNDSDETAQWAKSAVSWAEAYNMIDGIVGGRLKPASAATRAQAAAMLARLPKVEEEQTAIIIPGGNVAPPYEPPTHI